MSKNIRSPYWEWIKRNCETKDGKYIEPIQSNPDQLEYIENLPINPYATKLKDWLRKGGLDDFSPIHKRVFELSFFHGMSVKDVSIKLSRSIRQIKRIKSALRSRIGLVLNLQ